MRPTLRSFHLRCLGAAELPEGNWTCTPCLEGTHPCIICKSPEAGEEVRWRLNPHLSQRTAANRSERCGLER